RQGKIHVDLVKRWLDDAIRIETEEATPSNQWRHVFVTYDGSRLASGIKVYLDGQPAKIKINLDDLNQNFKTSEPLRIGAGGAARFKGAIDDVRLFNDVIAAEDDAIIANTDSLRTILGTPAARRTPIQQRKLRQYFLEQNATYQAMLRAQKDL